MAVVVSWKALQSEFKLSKSQLSEDCVSTRCNFWINGYARWRRSSPGNIPPSSSFVANVSLPQKFDIKGNLAANRRKWLQISKANGIVTGLDKQPSALRIASFITCIGPAALEIHTELPFSPEDERENIDKVLELWQNYCIEKANVTYERYKFNNRPQSQMSRLMSTQTRFARLPKPANLAG